MQPNPQWEMTPAVLKHVVEQVMYQTNNILIVVSTRSISCDVDADDYTHYQYTSNTAFIISVYEVQIYLTIFSIFQTLHLNHSFLTVMTH